MFRAPLLRCTDVAAGVAACVDAGFALYRLRAGSGRSLFRERIAPRALLVLGGETEGISPALQALPGTDLEIPMAAGVESLNVAVAASLVAYAAAGHFDR